MRMRTNLCHVVLWVKGLEPGGTSLPGKGTPAGTTHILGAVICARTQPPFPLEWWGDFPSGMCPRRRKASLCKCPVPASGCFSTIPFLVCGRKGGLYLS